MALVSSSHSHLISVQLSHGYCILNHKNRLLRSKAYRAFATYTVFVVVVFFTTGHHYNPSPFGSCVEYFKQLSPTHCSALVTPYLQVSYRLFTQDFRNRIT